MTLAWMCSECRACFVQVDGVIFFESDQGMLADWDDHIRSTCEALDSIITVVSQAQTATS
jgi:hypothetical protein